MHHAQSIIRLTLLTLALGAGACEDRTQNPSPAPTRTSAAPKAGDATEASTPGDHTISLTGDPIRTDRRPSGLVVEVFAEGAGPALAQGQTGLIDFEMRLADGRVVDSSERRRASLSVPLVEGSAIAGLREGLEGMNVGEARRLRIPSDLAYGEVGRPPIPARADLIIDVTLLGVSARE